MGGGGLNSQTRVLGRARVYLQTGTPANTSNNYVDIWHHELYQRRMCQNIEEYTTASSSLL